MGVVGGSGGNSQALEEQPLRVLLPVQQVHTTSGIRSSWIFSIKSVIRLGRRPYVHKIRNGRDRSSPPIDVVTGANHRSARHLGRLFLCPNYHSRDVRRIDDRIEKLRPGERGKVNQLVADFLDLARDLLA